MRLLIGICTVFILFSWKPAVAYEVLDKAHQIRLGSGLYYKNYSLTSTAYNLSLPSTSSTPYRIEYLQKNYFFRISQNTTKFKSPTGYTPSPIESTFREFRAMKVFEPISSDGLIKDFKPMVGYALLHRGAKRSTPTTGLTAFLAHGLALGAAYQKSVSEDFTLDAQLSLILPIYFSERLERSGSYSNSQFAELYVSVMYPISRSIALAAGAMIDYGRLSFNGSGTNGTVDAKQSQLGFGFPLELRIFY